MNNQTKINTTKKAIIDAFVLLTKQEKPCTVNDIAQAAHINRSTFYRYFENKTALIEDCENTIISKIAGIYHHVFTQENTDSNRQLAQNYLEEVLNIVEQNLDLLYVLFKKVDNSHFYVKFKELLAVANHHFLKHLLDPNGPLSQKEFELLINYRSSAILGSIEFWSYHPQEYSRQDIVNFIKVVSHRDLQNYQ
ncbi:TetR/AcrR family transcriptional regulator [Lactobacillus sp. ESL0684]|uniref:TetR/AcrR family transcriptional regulator n=1 Tax=Lactobacillus sp. ESL0684 TaxID=2983213 RepID=UPI0023F9C8BE|nr:TetR/AcrR family transcriptional regulator [Lactobacillus sp. ESL0684]WEV43344.1 TetR/AcrR family transcriptional regulator [Lactobacillus sp. ESL0684]